MEAKTTAAVKDLSPKTTARKFKQPAAGQYRVTVTVYKTTEARFSSQYGGGDTFYTLAQVFEMAARLKTAHPKHFVKLALGAPGVRETVLVEPGKPAPTALALNDLDLKAAAASRADRTKLAANIRTARKGVASPRTANKAELAKWLATAKEVLAKRSGFHGPNPDRASALKAAAAGVAEALNHILDLNGGRLSADQVDAIRPLYIRHAQLERLAMHAR